MSSAVVAGGSSADIAIDPKRDRLVIIASTLGTVFEWYDFFVYGTLAAIIGKQFFPDYAAFLVYAAMIVVLILRPQGLVRGTGT